MSDNKDKLPHEWIVRSSKRYPDTVYYFNTITGKSTWDHPLLNVSKALANKKKKKHKWKTKKTVTSTNAQQSTSLPIAIVAPVSVSTKRKKSKSLNQNQTKYNKVDDSVSRSSINTSSMNEVDMTTDLEDNVLPNIVEKCDFSTADDIEMLDVSTDLVKIEDLATMSISSYCLVVDTNILLYKLKCIDEIKDTPMQDCGLPHLFIPWIVLQELDILKKDPNEHIRACARKAVRYIYSAIKSKHPRFHGQSPKEVKDWTRTQRMRNDDGILKCCMDLLQKIPSKKVMMLTDDKNLSNKTAFCNIPCYDFESKSITLKPHETMKDAKTFGTMIKTKKILKKEMLIKIDSFMCEARQLAKDVLRDFLASAMDEAYGTPWKHFKINLDLLKDILHAYVKYWRMVFSFCFSEKVLLHFQKLCMLICEPECISYEGDSCLEILTIFEEIFYEIKDKHLDITAHIKKVQTIHSKCKEIFSEEHSFEPSPTDTDSNVALLEIESSSVFSIFERNWIAINHLCGMLLNFIYSPSNISHSPSETFSPHAYHQLVMALYPGVQKIQVSMLEVINGVENNKDIHTCCEKLHKALIDLLPSLPVQSENQPLPFFSKNALERYCSAALNRDRIKLGYKQLEDYATKLDHVMNIMKTLPANAQL